MTLFFAPEVFPVSAPLPCVLPVLRSLQLGDVDSAQFILDTLSPETVGQALFAQLNAALALQREEPMAAVSFLENELPHLADSSELAKLYFQLAELSQLCGSIDIAAEYYAKATNEQISCALFFLRYAEVLWKASNKDEARTVFEKSCQITDDSEPWAVWARLERAEGSLNANQRALAIIRQGRARFSKDPDLINIQAACYLALESYDETLDVLSELPDDFADHPIVCCNRGTALFALSKYAESAEDFAQAYSLAPEMFDACFGLGRSLFYLGEDEDAEVRLLDALEITPRHEESTALLAQIYARTKRTAQALGLLEEGLKHADDPYTFRYLHAVTCFHADELDKAEESACIAMSLRPEADELNDLCGLLSLQTGEYEKAQSYFEKAAQTLVPKTSAYYSNLLYSKNFSADYSAEDVLVAHKRFGERFRGLTEDIQALFSNTAVPNRRLRIGYVSPDYRAHSVAFFMTSIIEGHDRNKFEVYVYSNTLRQDAMTDWFRDSVDHWRDIYAASYDDIRKRIVADKIDILVDLAGHTGDNLLPMFARRAAPVQVTYLGYPNTTGVPAMDYRLIDAVTDPLEEADALATERLYRLPHGFLCYRMIDDLLDIQPGPFSAGKPMTYGSFNTLMKISPPVFDAWAEIMRQVPDAHLVLKSKQFLNAKAVDWARSQFKQRGIEEDRLFLQAFTRTLGEHLSLYHEIDLALDTFPYNGTTTTCEAVSMGVPVLTLKGDRHCARVGESLIRSLSLEEEFLAEDINDYVQRAIAFAQRRQMLQELRMGLRDRLKGSPICDESGFVNDLETAYRYMWTEWCCATDRRYSLTPSQFELDLQAKCKKT